MRDSLLTLVALQETEKAQKAVEKAGKSRLKAQKAVHKAEKMHSVAETDVDKAQRLITVSANSYVH